MAKKQGTQHSGQNGANAAGGADDGDDDQEDISPATRDFILRTVNGAVSSQLGRKLPGALNEALSGAMAPIMERLDTIAPPKGSQQGQGQQNGQQGNPPAGGGQVPPELAQMQAEMAKLQAQLKQRDEQAAAERTKTRHAQRDNDITAALAAAGVDKLRLKGAAAVLRDTIVEVDDGNGGKRWAYRAQRDGYHDDLDIAAGVKEWAGTDEGKAYMAPTNAVKGGAGTRPGAGQGQGGRQPPQDPQVAKAQKQQDALNGLMQMVTGASDGATVNLGE